MEEADGQEKTLFLKTADNAQGKGLGVKKDRPVEIRYDLSKDYRKRVRAPVNSVLIFLSIFDHLFVVTVVTVNVVGFWRGLFGILSQLEDLYHLCFVYLLGSLIICHFTIARKAYKKHLENKNLCHFILRRGYTYIFGCACVAQWAGLWYFLDAMSGFDVYPPLAYSVICSAILIYIKLYRNVLAPPLTFCTDRIDEYFEFKTVFNIDPTKKSEGCRETSGPLDSGCRGEISLRGDVKPVTFPSLRSLHNTPSSRLTASDECNKLSCIRNLDKTPLYDRDGVVQAAQSTEIATLNRSYVSYGGPNDCLSVLDAVLSSVLIAPAVIAYWRGTWYLSDFYVFPENFRLNLIASTVAGTLVHVMFALAQECLQKFFHPDRHRIVFYLTSRLYTYVYSIASVNFWRGGWKVLDFYSGTDPVHVATVTAISLAALVGMKTMRNLLSAPLPIAVDSPVDYFRVPTMFKLMGTSVTSLYVLDCFFSVFVVGSLVVFVWRGTWCLTDVFLYPENEKFSAFGSLAVGYGIVIVVFIIQTPMKSLCEKLTGFWRILVADVYIFASFIGIINLWRGVWNLLNIYFLPESPMLSFWITHLGSFAFLVLIGCSNSTLMKGVHLDGEEGGNCVAFPVLYLRLKFKKFLNKDKSKNGSNYKMNVSTSICEDLEKGQKENPENGKTHQSGNDSSHEVK